MPKDDPSELFDLCDAEGVLLGRTKLRALVHRDGDWHRSAHIWVIVRGPDGESLILQRRGLAKDTHPGKVDVSVAGHLRAGETFDAVCREAEEEIGLALSPSDLVRLGTRHREDVGASRKDREVQAIFYAVIAEPLERLRPDPEEVAGVLCAPLEEVRALAMGERRSVGARELAAGERAPRDVVLRREELLLAPDGYVVSALGEIRRRLLGGDPRGWRVPAT